MGILNFSRFKKKKATKRQWTVYYAPSDSIGWKVRNLLFGQKAYYQADCDMINNGPGVMELVNVDTDTALVIFADQVDRMRVNFGYEKVRQDALTEFETFKRKKQEEAWQQELLKKQQEEQQQLSDYDGPEVS